MAQDLYAAAWVSGEGGPWAARHGLTSAAYQQAFDQFSAQGFRLTCVSGYEVAGQDRYAAIWEKKDGPPWVARHGLTAAAYQQTFDQLTPQGYRLKVVSAYTVGGQPRFAAVWEKAGGPAWAARHGLTGAAYQQTFDQLTRAGYRPRWVSVYTEGGQDRYAAVWEQAGGPAWVARHGLDEASFTATSLSLAGQGYDLVCADACTVGGRDLYAGIWEQRPEGSVAHHAMTSGTYQLRFEQVTAQGYRPRFVAGYSGVQPTDAVLRFTMQQQQQANWCWAAVAASVAAYYAPGTSWTQCLVANGQLNRTDCCGKGAATDCNVYGFLDDALNRTGHFVSLQNGTVTFAGTLQQMLQGRPLGVRVAWRGGGAHFVAATGCEDGFVFVSDPGSGTTSVVAYDTLTTSYNGSGTWTHSYFTKP